MDVRALHAAAAAGVTVSIITGRLYSGTRASAERIGVRGPVGCADGSHVVNAADHATLVHHGLRGAHSLSMRDSLMRHGAAGFLFAGDAIVHDAAGEVYLGYVRTWSNDVRRAEKLSEHDLWHADDGITAVVALGSEDQIARTHAEIERELPEAAQVVKFSIKRVAGLWGLVARAAGGTKGSALQWIATHHGFDLDECVCVGDWFNDVPMLSVAGRSFAMGHAPDEVKKVATDVLEETSEHGGGIARVITEVFGVRI